MPTRETKKMLEEKVEKLQAEIKEAKRQGVHVPMTAEDRAQLIAEDDGGSHAIDHLTILDDHVSEDTNKEPIEDIIERNKADVSFWNNSWAWTESENSYGDKPEDAWFINPTPKLIAEVMSNVPTVFAACETALVVGEQKEQLVKERKRHLEFLREALEGDIVSESLDLLTSYQGRLFESVQRYLGISASYESRKNAKNPDPEQIESAKMRKADAAGQCRGWVARILAIYEGYHAVVTDERAYNLSFKFDPLPPQDGQPASKEYGLYKWAVTQTLNKVGRRLARSIKTGKMDAAKYRIPRPWLDETQMINQLDADELIGDFN